MTHIIAVANQKGGVGKTTTAINLSQAMALNSIKTLVVDLDPQGNATQGLGIDLESIEKTVGDLILDRKVPVESAIYRGSGIDLIPATPSLARVERAMVGLTNSEVRLVQRLGEIRDRYSLIVLDTPPTFGPLMNSALNSADYLIVPVDCGYFGLVGIKELLAEVEEIKGATNPNLKVLGYLLTFVDQTKVAAETSDSLIGSFGESVFETQIRRNVRLKEAPAFGRSIFEHATKSAGAEDYFTFAAEVIARLQSPSCKSAVASH